ncbi:MAG TPA: luciferase family protein [Casimicrobiaceae bacterium]|nr:luciferase family protein [Casimicrobiaceae bacterium]
MSPTEQLRALLSALPGVVETRSRFGAAGRPAWCIDGREFAHLHSTTLLDLRLPRAAQARLRKDPRARFRRHASQWLELEFHTCEDVADLLALARKAAAAMKATRRTP